MNIESVMKTISPYNGAYGYLVNGVMELESPHIFYNESDIRGSHTVLPGETLQHIAYKYFGDSGGWFKIAMANNILNPFKEVKDGMILKIPFYEKRE